MKSRITQFILIVAITPIFLVGETRAQQGLSISTEEAVRWREDLRVLAAEIPARHKNAFHTTSAETFAASVAALHKAIPAMARHQIIVEMARIVALVGDGHTSISPTRDSEIRFNTVPVKLYFFKDGLFVRATTIAQRAWLGARIIKIGSATPAEALARVSEIIGRDNTWGARFFAPHLLVMPEILHALALSEDPRRATLLLERDGKQETVHFVATEAAQMMAPDTDMSWLAQPGWIDWRNTEEKSSNDSPLWLRDPANEFWMSHLSSSKLLYVQINKIANKPDETLAAFGKRVRLLADSDSVETLVLDLRLNRGGNGALLPPLVRELMKAKTDRYGHFYVISSRGTFSAAQFLLDRLETYTQAVFVGEPSSSKGNAYGDSRRIRLPNSGITVRASIYYWQDWHPLDQRMFIEPAIRAELTSEEYRNGIDPSLAKIHEDVQMRKSETAS